MRRTRRRNAGAGGAYSTAMTCGLRRNSSRFFTVVLPLSSSSGPILTGYITIARIAETISIFSSVRISLLRFVFFLSFRTSTVHSF